MKILFFKLNVVNYPNSHSTFGALGDFYAPYNFIVKHFPQANNM